MDRAPFRPSGMRCGLLRPPFIGAHFASERRPASTDKRMVKVRARTVAETFAPVILPLSTGQLAKAAQCTKEQTTRWRAGRSFPSGVALLNLAREIPEVRAWVIAQIGADCPADFESDEMLTRAFNALASRRAVQQEEK